MIVGHAQPRHHPVERLHVEKINVLGWKHRREIAGTVKLLLRQIGVLIFPPHAEIEGQLVVDPPAVLEIPRKDVLVVLRKHRRVVRPDPERRAGHTVNPVGNQHVITVVTITGHVVQPGIRGPIPVDRNARLEIVLTCERASREERGAGLEPGIGRVSSPDAARESPLTAPSRDPGGSGRSARGIGAAGVVVGDVPRVSAHRVQAAREGVTVLCHSAF